MPVYYQNQITPAQLGAADSYHVVVGNITASGNGRRDGLEDALLSWL